MVCVGHVYGVVGVDESLDVDGFAFGIVVGVAVYADETGACHIRCFVVDGLFQVVAQGEIACEGFVEKRVDARVVTAFGQSEHHFEPVFAWRCETKQHARIGLYLLANGCKVEVFLRNVVDVEDESLGVGKVLFLSEVGREVSAHHVGQRSFKRGVLFGVHCIHDTQLAYARLDVGTRVDEAVIELLFFDFEQRVGSRLNVFSARNHRSKDLNFCASDCT